jgi:hypothetical protein
MAQVANGGNVSARLPIPPEWLNVLADLVADKLADRLQPPEPSPYVTTTEAAAFLRCSTQRVHDLLSSGRLMRVKEGRRKETRR